jgi:hypothetical protein
MEISPNTLNLRLQRLQKIIESSLPDLLGAIRNHPPGVLEQEFIHGPKIGGITIGGFGIHWWIVDEQPFYKLALELTRCEPSLSDRYSVDEIVHKVNRVICENLKAFNISLFVGSCQKPPTTLLKCASPIGLAAVSKEILDLIYISDRAVFLFPVRRLRPETDVISPSRVWLTRSAPRHLIEQLPQAGDPRLAFDRFPPLLDGEALHDEDSMLGLIANGWQGAVTALRRLAGAVCLILPYHEATLKSLDGQVGATAALFDDGRIEIRALGPFLPLLVDPILVKGDSLNQLGNFLEAKNTKERENRFRVALEFLALGWLLQGSQAFMNWCIAIDALFGAGGTEKWKQSIKEGVRERLSGLMVNPDDRVGLLVDIRSDLLHGRCSRISNSKHYLRYWKRFQCDPLQDAFHILRECLIREL